MKTLNHTLPRHVLNLIRTSFNGLYISPKLSRLSKLTSATALCAISIASLADVSLVEESLITDEGLYFWYANGSKAFHYNPNISPRGDSVTIANGYIFFGWYKGGMTNRQLMLSRKKIGSGGWVTVEFPYKNTLIGPQKRWGDSHNTISVGVSEKDGTVHIFYDHHNDPLKYVISDKNAAFVSDSEFTSARFNPTRGYLAPGQDIRITYPTLTENSDGDIVLNYRKGSAVGGNEMVHYYDGNEWSRSKMVSRGSGRGFVDVEDRNYAYGRPVYANGNVYYAFSVRWARKKPDGILNEGVYLAKTGPTMTGQWEDLNGVKHALPVQDFSPFLIDLPASNNGKGSSGGPGLAVSDNGDVHISFDGRGQGDTYEFTYTRKADETEFTKHDNVKAAGIAWGNKIYKASAGRDGVIHIKSTPVGEVVFTTELSLETEYTFGHSIARIVDGQLVVIAEDRTVDTDAQNLLSYVFDLDDTNQAAPVNAQSLPEGYVFAAEEGDTVNVNGEVDIAFGANGQFNFLYNQTRNVTCSTRRFGDPIVGVRKQCYTSAVAAGPEVSFANAVTTLQPNYSELSLIVNATATQQANINNVQLFINNNLIREERVAPYEWGHGGRDELLGLPEGEHTIKAVATDNNGLQTESSYVFTVAPLKPEIHEATGYQSPNHPSSLLDGDRTDDSRWTVNGFNNSVTLDLGTVRQINAITLWAYENRAYQYTVAVSNQPETGFTIAVDARNNTAPLSAANILVNQTGRYLKFTVTGAHNYARDWVSINELEIDSQPVSD